jgi:hypothetical protein
MSKHPNLPLDLTSAYADVSGKQEENKMEKLLLTFHYVDQSVDGGVYFCVHFG